MRKPVPCFVLVLCVASQGLSLTDQENPMSKNIPMRIVQLRCESLTDPLGTDVTKPRLSWKMISTRRGQRQTAYQVLVASSPKLLRRNRGDQWNSGKVGSDQSVQVEYQGTRLESGKAYYWKVRVWDRDSIVSAWSKPALWTMGMLNKEDWKGKWVGLDEVDKTYHLTGTQWIWFPRGEADVSAVVTERVFRRAVRLPDGQPITKALFHIAANNGCTVFANGIPVCKASTCDFVSEVDLTKRLHGGVNVLAVSAPNAGERPAPAGLIGLLEVQFADGASLKIATDSAWKAYDKEVAGWQSTEFNDSGWISAEILGPAGMPPWGEMYGPDDRRLPARWLRKEFEVDKKLRRAVVYFCGLGLSELYLNGTKVGDHVLSPALSEYPKRVYYVAHDVTAALTSGRNAVGVVLGNGRYFAPRMRQPTLTQTYGYPKLLLQLHLEYADGTCRDVLSDTSWKLTIDGPIRANSEYDGEEYDARKEFSGWARIDYDDRAWQTPQIVSAPAGELRAQMIKPIRVTGTLKPISLTEPKPGVFIFDMGQNMVGWCRLKVRGQRGMQVSLRHAETLTPDGELYLDNIRGAKVTDLYTLKGEGTEVYEPRFTYHGFRFVEVRGFPGRPKLSALEGHVVNDDVETAGDFTCSQPVINRVYQNVVWGVRGNYRSIPTDCPQRDERQGWLGDRSAESRGETYLFDVGALYAKWLQDMADAQKDNGSVSDVCPSYWPLYNDDVTWPSSTVIIPATLLDQYGDSDVIRRHYPSMMKWIDHMSSFIKKGVIEKDMYGDWCVPPEDPKLIHSKDPMRKTAPAILATSFFYHDLCLMSRYARLLGNLADVRRFDELAKQLKEGLNERFFNPERGYYDNGSQTSCVLSLAFDMVPPEHRKSVFDHLVQKIEQESNRHVGTGLIGGQWLNRVLAQNGRPDLAFAFATNTTYPSWGYMCEKGATTIWELWNGDSADPAMNSGNHVMLVGDLVIWLYEGLAGIKPDPDRSGFKHILMWPTPAGDLKFVKATHNSPYGLIASEWRKKENRFEWALKVPVNTSATIRIPAVGVETITESGRPVRKAPCVKFLQMENQRAVFEVEAGEYHFTSRVAQ
jgi:alpha-L-rhamnosidase